MSFNGRTSDFQSEDASSILVIDSKYTPVSQLVEETGLEPV